MHFDSLLRVNFKLYFHLYIVTDVTNITLWTSHQSYDFCCFRCVIEQWALTVIKLLRFLVSIVLLWCLHECTTGFMATLTICSAKATIVPHWTTWSWYTDRWWVGCYIWYSREGTGWGHSPPRTLLAVPNVTAHPSTASDWSLPITVLLYNGLLLCSFNVPVQG